MPPELKIHLISAFWQWAEEEGRTTYLQVQADHGTMLPNAFVVNGMIVLNITAEATHQLNFAPTRITFQGRFGGKVSMVEVPAERISAVFIKDSDIGLVFPVTDSPGAAQEATPPKLSKLAKVSANTALPPSSPSSPPDDVPPPPKPRLKKL